MFIHKKFHHDFRRNKRPYSAWLNPLIILDDCTEENGAEWLLEKPQNRTLSHKKNISFKNAKRTIGKREIKYE